MHPTASADRRRAARDELIELLAARLVREALAERQPTRPAAPQQQTKEPTT